MLSSVNGFMRKEAKETSVYFYTRRGVPTRHKRTRTHANAKHNRHAHSQRTRTTRTIWKIKVADLSTRHTYAHSYICGHAGSSDVAPPAPKGVVIVVVIKVRQNIRSPRSIGSRSRRRSPPLERHDSRAAYAILWLSSSHGTAGLRQLARAHARARRPAPPRGSRCEELKSLLLRLSRSSVVNTW